MQEGEAEDVVKRLPTEVECFASHATIAPRRDARGSIPVKKNEEGHRRAGQVPVRMRRRSWSLRGP